MAIKPRCWLLPFKTRLDITFPRGRGILFDFWPTRNCYDPQWRTIGFSVGLFWFRGWWGQGYEEWQSRHPIDTRQRFYNR